MSRLLSSMENCTKRFVTSGQKDGRCHYGIRIGQQGTRRSMLAYSAGGEHFIVVHASRCRKPLATKRALYLSMFPAASRLTFADSFVTWTLSLGSLNIFLYLLHSSFHWRVAKPSVVMPIISQHNAAATVTTAVRSKHFELFQKIPAHSCDLSIGGRIHGCIVCTTGSTMVRNKTSMNVHQHQGKLLAKEHFCICTGKAY